VVGSTIGVFGTSNLKSAIAGTVALVSAGVMAKGIKSWTSNQKEAISLQRDEIKESKKNIYDYNTGDKMQRSAKLSLSEVNLKKLTHKCIAIIGATISGCTSVVNISQMNVESISKCSGFSLAIIGIGALAAIYGTAETSNDICKQKRLELKASHYKYI